MKRILNKTAKRSRAREAAIGAMALLVVAATACGTGQAVHDPMARASARLEATETLPACRGSWLKLSIPRISPTSVSPTGRDISRRTPDRITVTSSQPCTLKGWPVFEQVRHSNHVTGARPRYTTIKVGYAKVVTLGPGRAAVAFATVTVPKGWIWSGGNTCATFPSAFVKLPSVPHAFFVEDLSSTIVTCAGPVNEPFRVTVGPFRAARTAGQSLIPVPFGDVEISVPGMWWVELPGSESCSGQPPSGELLLGNARLVTSCGAPVPANVAHLFYIKQVPPKYAQGHPIWVHGVKVIVGRSGKSSVTWYLPGVLEELQVRGPLAHTLVWTLRFSPRRGVLSSAGVEGSPLSGTDGWHRVSWGGLSALVPRSWSVVRTDVSNYPECATDETSLPKDQVLLDSDRRDVYPPCPYQFPTVSTLFGNGGTGLRIDLQPAKPDSGVAGLSSDCFHPNGLTVCPYASPQMAVLELLVTGGGLLRLRLVWIGLSGSGAVSTTTLRSLSSTSVRPVASTAS
jgi:hypothetical protein